MEELRRVLNELQDRLARAENEVLAIRSAMEQLLEELHAAEQEIIQEQEAESRRVAQEAQAALEAERLEAAKLAAQQREEEELRLAREQAEHAAREQAEEAARIAREAMARAEEDASVEEQMASSSSEDPSVDSSEMPSAETHDDNPSEPSTLPNDEPLIGVAEHEAIMRTIEEMSRPMAAKPTVEERFKGAKTVADKVGQQHLSDIKRGIGINERFLYANELFKGDMSAFTRAIEELNHVESLADAQRLLDQELADKYHWDDENDTVVAFKSLVSRRFA